MERHFLAAAFFLGCSTCFKEGGAATGANATQESAHKSHHAEEQSPAIWPSHPKVPAKNLTYPSRLHSQAGIRDLLVHLHSLPVRNFLLGRRRGVRLLRSRYPGPDECLRSAKPSTHSPPRGRAVGSQALTHPRRDAPRVTRSIAVSEVVNLVPQGELPELVRPHVCGASIRPIAIGETVRRLTRKVAVDLVTDRARSVLEPPQLGRGCHPRHAPVVSPPPLQPGQGCPVVGRLQCVQNGAPFHGLAGGPRPSPLNRALGRLLLPSREHSFHRLRQCHFSSYHQRKRRLARRPPGSGSFCTRYPPGHQRSTSSSGNRPHWRHRFVFLFPRPRVECRIRPGRLVLPLGSHQRIPEDRP